MVAGIDAEQDIYPFPNCRCFSAPIVGSIVLLFKFEVSGTLQSCIQTVESERRLAMDPEPLRTIC